MNLLRSEKLRDRARAAGLVLAGVLIAVLCLSTGVSARVPAPHRTAPVALKTLACTGTSCPPVNTWMKVRDPYNGTYVKVDVLGTVFRSEREDRVYCTLDGNPLPMQPGTTYTMYCSFGPEDGAA